MSIVSRKIRIGLAFLSYGPYHLARINACDAIKGLEVIPIAMSRMQSEYDWGTHDDQRLVVLESKRDLDDVKLVEWRHKIGSKLNWNSIDVMFIAGYSHVSMLALIEECTKRKVPLVIMGDSQESDEVRKVWVEKIKSRVLRLASSALVAGRPHRQYFEKLGVPGAAIFDGYDVVDNDFFASLGNTPRLPGVPRRFFLVSSRFIKKKNLFSVLSAYSRFQDESRGKACSDPSHERCPDLVLLGDGELREALKSCSKKLNLSLLECAPWESDVSETRVNGTVYMPGFRSYPELPKFYAGATALIHASTSEQWGLVVNEAMASGLPVIVSRNCGCAPDLVAEGVNGWTFDPLCEQELGGLMMRMASMPEFQRVAMGKESQRIIREWGPARFAKGLEDAARFAMQVGSIKAGVIDRLLLAVLLRR